jgi:general secretion pathway protein K
MKRNNQIRAGSRNGSIIVLVLVLVVLLTFIVVAFLEEATAKIKYYGLFHNRDDLRTDAYSAMEISLAVVNQYREIEGALWGPSQGWGNPLGEIDFQPAHASAVTVRFEDESAKLPLRSMDYDSLLVFFDILGFDLQEAQSLADGLLDWTDEDDLRRLNGFDGEDYDDMEPPYRPANSPIVTWDEFFLIEPFRELFYDEDGIPTDRWATFKSAVSLFNEGSVNINQANDTIIAYLEERGVIDSRSFYSYKNGSDGEVGTEDDRVYRAGQGSFTPAESNEVSDGIELLRVSVEASRGEARFVLEALVSWSGANPGAGDTNPVTDTESRTTPVEESDPETAAARRTKARGKTRTAPSAAATLGYPFRFIRITENRKF